MNRAFGALCMFIPLPGPLAQAGMSWAFGPLLSVMVARLRFVVQWMGG